MPARRLPDAWHQKRGTYRADRHGTNRPATAPPAERVGDPPAHLSPEAVEVWQALAVAGWWLGEVDRAALEVACFALLAMRAEPKAASITAASKALADLGLSPRARGAVVGLSPAPQRNTEEDLRIALLLGEFGPEGETAR